MKAERLHITIFLAIAAITWFIVLLVQGTPATWEHASPFTTVISVLVLLGIAFERWLWRQPFLHGWFVKRPDLRGTWRVELRSSYIAPDGGKRVPMVVCYMGVSQTLSKLQMHLMTPESESWLIADHIRPSANADGFQVIGVYTNEPNIHLRNHRASEIHQGTLIAETHGPSLRPDAITAKYWSDRRTTGTMEFTARVEEVFTRFADAHSRFSEAMQEEP